MQVKQTFEKYIGRRRAVSTGKTSMGMGSAGEQLQDFLDRLRCCQPESCRGPSSPKTHLPSSPKMSCSPDTRSFNSSV